MGLVRAAQHSKEHLYTDVIRDCIKAGGCSASRAAIAGAFAAAASGPDAIPTAWINNLKVVTPFLDNVTTFLNKAHK